MTGCERDFGHGRNKRTARHALIAVKTRTKKELLMFEAPVNGNICEVDVHERNS
jgi:hypothetical protein